MTTIPHRDENETPSHVEVAEPFAMLPEALLYDPSISMPAKCTYGVLLRHGSDPQNCYPSHRRIAGFLGAKQASVGRWVKELEDAGWIKRVARFTPSGDPDTNAYVVYPRALQRGVPATERGGVPATERGGSPLYSATKESNGNESNLNESDALVLELISAPGDHPHDRFDDFWEVFPLKKGKPAAKKAWVKAVKVDHPDVIIAGARAYAKDQNRNPSFTKYPQGWLNDERWKDAPPERPATVEKDRVFLPGSGWVSRR